MVKPGRAYRRAREAFRLFNAARKGVEQTSEQIDIETKEGKGMKRYKKAVGAIVGGLLGILAVKVPVLAPLLTDGVTQQVVIMVTGLLGTIAAPKNAD